MREKFEDWYWDKVKENYPQDTPQDIQYSREYLFKQRSGGSYRDNTLQLVWEGYQAAVQQYRPEISLWEVKELDGRNWWSIRLSQNKGQAMGSPAYQVYRSANRDQAEHEVEVIKHILGQAPFPDPL